MKWRIIAIPVSMIPIIIIAIQFDIKPENVFAIGAIPFAGAVAAMMMKLGLQGVKFTYIARLDEKIGIFLFDGSLVTSPVNFVSISLLATSIKLRLGIPTINVLTKTDLIGEKLKEVLDWSTNLAAIESAISRDTSGETYTLTTDILRSLNLGDLAQELIPISNVTGEGMVNLESVLSRIINFGEEVED